MLEVLAEAQPFIQRLLSLSVGQQSENDHKCDAERKVAPNDLQGRSPLNLKPEHQTGNDKSERQRQSRQEAQEVGHQVSYIHLNDSRTDGDTENLSLPV